MKITRKQLRRIIREEKQLLKEQPIRVGAGGVPYGIQNAIDGWAYRSSEELNGLLSQEDRDWNENPLVIDSIQRALENLIEEFEGWRK